MMQNISTKEKYDKIAECELINDTQDEIISWYTDKIFHWFTENGKMIAAYKGKTYQW